jgi:hypothetical protein
VLEFLNNPWGLETEKEPVVVPAYIAWRASTTTTFLFSVSSPIDCSKIPALDCAGFPCPDLYPCRAGNTFPSWIKKNPVGHVHNFLLAAMGVFQDQDWKVPRKT